MKTFQNKNKIYLKTTVSFNKPNIRLKKPILYKNLSNLPIINNQDNLLPMLKSNKLEKTKNEEKLINKVKIKKTKFFKSQEKLNRLIKEEENFRDFYLNLIKNKVKDEEIDFNNFLEKTNDILENEAIKNTLLNNKGNIKDIKDEKTQKNIEKEEKKVFHNKSLLGKNEFDINDYTKRYQSLFPGENMEDESEFNLKTKSAMKIQQYFREHKNKKIIYKGFEEPNDLIRIYEHECDEYSKIKSIEIKIYSLLFQKNVSIIKTIEELFGVRNISREKIQKKINEIIGKILGFKKWKKIQNEDYYDKEKADLSSDDFDDFLEDD